MSCFEARVVGGGSARPGFCAGRIAGALAVLFLLAVSSGAEAAVPTATDRTAPEALYDATDGANWADNTNWKTAEGN